MENINSMNLKPSDLKIGNLVMFHNETIGEVTGLDVMNIQVNNYYPLLPVKGIPLTGEWLIKFGFELMEPSEYTLDTYEKEGIKFWNIKGDFSEILIQPYKINVKYVHQLQNLYFALTGKELS